MKYKKIISAFGLFALIFALASCNTAPDAVESEMPEGVAIHVMQVGEEDLSRENIVSGRISASSQSSVYVPGSVKVSEVYVKEGDRVQKGDAVARLDMSTLAIPSASLEQINVLNLQMDMAMDAWNASKALYEIGAASEVEVENAQLQYLSVKLQRDSAVASLGAGMSYAGATVEFSDAAGTVVASESGTVTVLNAVAGEYATAESPFVTIQGSEHSYVSVSVSESLKPLLSVGDPVHVRVSSIDQEFEGSIRTIDASASAQTKLYAVTVSIPEDVQGISSGMFADVTFYTDTAVSAIAVPSECVLTGEDGSYVYVVQDGAARRTSVVTGMTTGGLTEILSGLAAGDMVVTVGQTYLSDGEAVRIVSGE